MFKNNRFRELFRVLREECESLPCPAFTRLPPSAVHRTCFTSCEFRIRNTGSPGKSGTCCSETRKL